MLRISLFYCNHLKRQQLLNCLTKNFFFFNFINENNHVFVGGKILVTMTTDIRTAKLPTVLR
jgi:hypothetical protein